MADVQGTRCPARYIGFDRNTDKNSGEHDSSLAMTLVVSRIITLHLYLYSLDPTMAFQQKPSAIFQNNPKRSFSPSKPSTSFLTKSSQHPTQHRGHSTITKPSIPGRFLLHPKKMTPSRRPGTLSAQEAIQGGVDPAHLLIACKDKIDKHPQPFDRLPTEIRLEIYRYLVGRYTRTELEMKSAKVCIIFGVYALANGAHLVRSTSS